MNPVQLLVSLCIGILLHVQAVNAEQQAVLVATATSPLDSIDSLELREIYLGFTVWRDGRIVKGLRNTGDKELNRIFLQTVVAMSEKSYTRRLLSMLVREGTPRPPEYDSETALINALSRDPYSVSYMWKDSALKTPQIKILRVLWRRY